MVWGIRILMMMAVCLSLNASSAWCQSLEINNEASPNQSSSIHPAFRKLGRGVANFTGGWLEIPSTMSQSYQQHDTYASLVAGLAQGLLKTVVRTGVGLFEVVSFFVPLPENYAPVLPTQMYYDRAKARPALPLERPKSR